MKAKIYTTTTCNWCEEAKKLLTKMKLEYEEIQLDSPSDSVENITKFRRDCPGEITVPQIFIEGVFIGGYRELFDKQQYENMFSTPIIDK